MAIVSIAILISFHLKSQPTALERRFAFPFGIVFWCLALACLASGTANYIKTVTKYSKREAIVQSGWKTQIVSFCCFCFSYLFWGGVWLTRKTGFYGRGYSYCRSLRFISFHGLSKKRMNPTLFFD